MVRVKICGITRQEDALAAMRAGAHALGLVFYPQSPRFVSPSLAKRMISSLPPLVSWVGVFVDYPVEGAIETARQVGVDTIQLHGRVSPYECRYYLEKGFKVIRSVRVGSEEDLKGIEKYRGAVSAILLDTKIPGLYGGTGRTFPWELARLVEGFHVILAGGLNQDNVAQAIGEVRPWGVDVSSGVEKEPGIKDHRLMELFVRRVMEVRG